MNWATKNRRFLFVMICIIMYFWALVILSHIIAPENYGLKPIDRLISFDDFFIMSGEGSAWLEPESKTLVFSDAEPGEKVFAAKLPLTDYQKVIVAFKTDCAEFCEKTQIHIDLCDSGYDSENQESVILPQTGEKVSQTEIDKGDNAPETAYLRIFTLDPAELRITDLNIMGQLRSDGFSVRNNIIMFLIVLVIVVGSRIIISRKKQGGSSGNHV